MSTPRVSIVVPFLDPPTAFFHRAIESVRSQTFPAWELVLVDDGSGCEARAVAEEWAARDGRIRVGESPPPRPAGANGARDAGLRSARGEFLALLDADDVWQPRRLDRHVTALDEHGDVAMVCSRALHWTSWREAAGHEDYTLDLGVRYGMYLPPSFAAGVIRGVFPVPPPCSVTVRRAAAETCGGFPTRWTMYEDQAFYVNLASRHTVLRIPDVLAKYRIHPASVMGRSTSESRREARWRFLSWCRDVSAADLPEPARRQVLRAVRHAEWRLRHPRLAVVDRLARKAVRRLRGRGAGKASRWRE